MRKLLLSSAALAAMSVAAFGADLPARGAAVAPAPMYAAPMFTWSGFYVGLNAGAAFQSDKNRADSVTYTGVGPVPGYVDTINAQLAAVPRRNGDDTGFTGGAQIGYNWQFGALVVGIEADINAMSRGDRSGNYSVANIGGSGDRLDVYEGRRGSNWFGTLRPRVGYAFDRTMIYVTGGLAYSGNGGNRGGFADVVTPGVGGGPDVIQATYSDNRRSSSNWGYAIGGGVEHAFSNNWTAKLEYLYVDLDRGNRGNYTTTSLNPTYNTLTGRRGAEENGFHVVRVGLNYKFGGSSAGPVLARY